jgi:hypothetical protein
MCSERFVTCMSDSRRGFGLVNRFTDHLQVVTASNYNTIISTFYISLEHTVWCSHSVTRRFLVTAPKMAIPLPPAQVLSSQTPVQNCQLTLALAYNISARTREKTQLFHCCSPTVALLRICGLATGTCLPSRCPTTVPVYRVTA